MSGLENLQTRLQYKGGEKQIDRMKSGKVAALKKALLYSYQSATAILSDKREFRCLINKDKLKTSADDKIISIPFADICLNENNFSDNYIGKFKTSEGLQKIGMKPGDVFTWKETNTDWIVYLQRLEETAYFRAEIRRCKYSITIDGQNYKVFTRQKQLGEISWHTAKEISWNDLDYSLEMYITNDENTRNYFKRFTIVEIDGRPWEVQASDNLSVDGIVMVALKEYYTNTMEKEIQEERQQKEEENKVIINTKRDPYIKGESIVYPYDEVEYSIQNAGGGKWEIGSPKATIISQTETDVIVGIVTGRSGEFDLKYIRENEEDIVLHITIESL